MTMKVTDKGTPCTNWGGNAYEDKEECGNDFYMRGQLMHNRMAMDVEPFTDIVAMMVLLLIYFDDLLLSLRKK
jgi:hypothetical protein